MLLQDEAEKSEQIEEPKGYLKTMVDKMAEYVHRNGVEFEENIKKKNDERFDFLNEKNIYFKYYKNKLTCMKEAAGSSVHLASPISKNIRRSPSRSESSESETDKVSQKYFSSSSQIATTSSDSEDDKKKQRSSRKKHKSSHKKSKKSYRKHSRRRHHKESSSKRKRHRSRDRS
jgi:hypothetical protein